MHLTALGWFPAVVVVVGGISAKHDDGAGSVHAVSAAVRGGFVENRGQWPTEVLYHGWFGAAGATIFADHLLIAGPVAGADERLQVAVALRFPQSATGARGEVPTPTLHHFHYGAGTVAGARAFGRVVLSDVAAGIDVAIREDAGRVAYDLIVEPGARIQDLEIVVEGVEELRLDRSGELEMSTALGPIPHRLGDCWQADPVTGARSPIEVRCRLIESSEDRFGFHVDERDPARELVVDPTLMFCTYAGSATGENLDDAVVAPDGSTYLLTRTSGLLPLSPGVFEAPGAGVVDMWIGKLAPDGSHLAWSGRLGGSDVEHANWLAVAPDGGVVVTGRTWSLDFPTTAGAYQSNHVAKSDATLTRISADGASILASTLIGGDGQDGPQAIAVSPDGSITVVLDTTSTGIHATPDAFDVVKDSHDKLILRLAADLSAVEWATWFHVYRVNSVALDLEGDVIVAGESSAQSGTLPTTPEAFMPLLPKGADPDAGYVGKLRRDGSAVEWGTYLAGATDQKTDAWGVCVGGDGCVFVVGRTVSDDFPTTSGAFSNLKLGPHDGFALKLLADGSDLVWSTFIGGCCGGGGYTAKCSVDAAGNLWAFGNTNEPNWPTTLDALFPSFVGGFPSSDAVATKFDALGEALVYSTHVAGSGSDAFTKAGLAADGTVRLAFDSYSSDLPVTAGAYQTSLAGLNDLAVVGLDVPLLPWRVLGGQSESAPHVPNLVGTGTLQPGAPTRLVLRGGAPNGIAWVVLGLAELKLPLPELGCELYPWPDFLIPLPLGPQGGFDITFPAPDGPGDLFLQVVGFHAEAPGGLYFSNGLRTKRP